MIIIKSEEDIAKMNNAVYRNMVERVYNTDIKGAVEEAKESGHEFGDLVNFVVIEDANEMFESNEEAHIREDSIGILHAYDKMSFIEVFDEHSNFYSLTNLVGDDGFGIVYIIPKALNISIAKIMPVLCKLTSLQVTPRITA